MAIISGLSLNLVLAVMVISANIIASASLFPAVLVVLVLYRP